MLQFVTSRKGVDNSPSNVVQCIASTQPTQGRIWKALATFAENRVYVVGREYGDGIDLIPFNTLLPKTWNGTRSQGCDLDWSWM